MAERNLEELPAPGLGFFCEAKVSGDLIQRQMVHTENVGAFVLALLQSLREVFLLLCLYVMMLIISLKATLVVTAVGVLFYIVTSQMARLKVFGAAKASKTFRNRHLPWQVKSWRA